MMQVSPSSVARDRYQRCFQSSLFDPPEEPRRVLAPAGKRRDQTVTELFGEATQGKNLTFQEGTFQPRSDLRSARQKKQEFLDSTVLPKTHFEAQEAAAHPDVDGEDTAEPIARRLHENQSHILGSEQEPGMTAEEDAAAQARYYENRLRPTSFRWYQYPEEAPYGESPEKDHQTASGRAFHEKQSTIFDHTTQDSQKLYTEELQGDKAYRVEAERKRRANCYYSDLFGRETPLDQQDQQRFPKPKGAPEDRIVIHGEWTDSRTEIERGQEGPLVGAGSSKATPATRKRYEFNATKVFAGEEEGGQKVTPHCKDVPEPCLTYTDNSAKVERHTTDVKALHQQHLQSTVMGNGFYAEAENRTSVAVAELHIAGLKPEMDGRAVATLVSGAGFHVIKADANMDPVNNRCKGTCKLQVRYNPGPAGSDGLEPIEQLVQFLGKHGLHAAM